MKQLITTLAIAITMTSFSQTQFDYLIKNRFIGYKDSCNIEQVAVWAPTLDDGNHTITIRDGKMIVEQTHTQTDTYITGEGIDNWETEKEQKVIYFATVDNALCKITLYLNKEHQYFHIYIEYQDWILGYNVIVLDKKKKKKK